MKIYKTKKTRVQKINTTENFIGESLEEKVRRITETNAPIESVSPMVYTERKDGVRKDTNIRTDKFDIAMMAMDSIATGVREKRNERMSAKTAQPDANSMTNVPTEVDK